MGFCCAAMLAGGASRRMGGIDKQLLPAAGKSLSALVLDRLGAEFSERIVVTDRRNVYDEYPGRLTIVPDLIPGYGPLSGLHAALSASRSDWIYLTACDMPFFSPAWARFLIRQVVDAERRGEFPRACVASREEHIEPFHALYSKSLLPDIVGLLRGECPAGRAASFSTLLRRNRHLRIPEKTVRRYSEDWSMFFNVNTPADWDAYRALGSYASPRERTRFS